MVAKKNMVAKKYTTEMSFSCERCLPRGRVASPFPSRRPDQLRGQAGQQAAHRHVDQLCQTWVGSYRNKEECEDFLEILPLILACGKHGTKGENTLR